MGGAASVLMLSLVGWEAIAPLTAQLAKPGRQLPRIIASAFVITAVVYLSLAVTTIAVFGRDAAVPCRWQTCSASRSERRDRC